MPNHVTNILSIQGSEASRQNILRSICAKDDPEQVICFDRIIPMPESLNIESSSRSTEGLVLVLTAMAPDSNYTLQGFVKLQPNIFARLCHCMTHESWKTDHYHPLSLERIGRLHKQADFAKYVALGKAALRNLAQHGATDWYSWRLQHWGTKWDAYETSLNKDGTLRFLTAWSCPQPVTQRLSERFPDVTMDHLWADENIGHNVGRAVYHAGQVLKAHLPTEGSEAAIQLSRDIMEMAADGAPSQISEEENTQGMEGMKNEFTF